MKLEALTGTKDMANFQVLKGGETVRSTLMLLFDVPTGGVIQGEDYSL